MTPIRVEEIASLGQDGDFHAHLAPVYETVSRLRGQLPAETTLIGFCGAPWTVATYMIAGKGTPDQAPSRLFGYRNPEAIAALLAKLAEVSADYLVRQIEAGADVVQIFDSWAGVLDEASFATWCVEPVAEIVRRVRAIHPSIPIIGFPRGAGSLYADYRQRTGVTALGLDWSVPLSQARALQKDGAVQGNLDPLRLVVGGRALDEGVDAILGALGGGPLVFNLGHGITPEAPIRHVEQMLRRVRG
jgi:uroporphyrinogen decarboxylase